MRKSQINAQIFTYILTAFLIILVLIFSFKVFGSFKQKQRDATIIELEEKLKGLIDLGSGEYGAIKKVELRVPVDITRVCFIDLSKKDSLINGDLAQIYPEVRQSLKEDAVPKNVFLIAGNVVTDALYAGKICLPEFEGYKCIETTDHYLRFLIEGKQDCVNIIKPLESIVIHNNKNMEKYEGNPIFLMRDTIINKQAIPQYIPVAMWNDRKGGIKLYPYYVYYENGAQEPAEFIKPIVDKHDHTEWKLRFLGGNPTNLPKSTITYFDNIYKKEDMPITVEEEDTDLDSYLEYWQPSSLVDVVMIEKKDTEAAVMGSLFASYIIAPVIFVDSKNIEDSLPYFKGKRVFVVYSERGQFYGRSLEYINLNSKETLPYTSNFLRITDTLDTYRKIMSQLIPSSS